MMGLALLLVLGLQDDAKIAEWIRDLGDDGIDIRERAVAALVRAGRRAEPALREAMKGGGEVRGRAAQVLEEIARAERALMFESHPSRITLHRKDAPLKEVLEEIQKQTSARLVFAFAPDEKVTFDVEGLPLFEAIDLLCRTSKNASYQVEPRRDESLLLTVSEGRFADAPRLLQDQYFLRLEGIGLTTTYDLRGNETSRTRLSFRWGWEKGTRPQTALIRLEELQDDQGVSYLGDLAPDGGGRPVGFAFVQTSQAVEMAKVPSEKATHFRRIKGALELSFPESLLAFVFDKPEDCVGMVRKVEGASVKMVTCARDQARLQTKIEVRPAELGGRLELKAVDREGREVAGRYTRGEHNTEDAILMTVDFSTAADLVSLRFAAPAGTREKRLPFEFRDVRFR
jgi:hypothetical protein